MADWLEELFADFTLIAKSLDQYADNRGGYQQAIAELYQCVLNPELTLSGQIMSTLKENDWDFSQLGMDLAHRYRDEFTRSELELYQDKDFADWKEKSEQAFAERKEQDNVVDFDHFLRDYFTAAAKSGAP